MMKIIDLEDIKVLFYLAGSSKGGGETKFCIESFDLLTNAGQMIQ